MQNPSPALHLLCDVFDQLTCCVHADEKTQYPSLPLPMLFDVCISSGHMLRACRYRDQRDRPDLGNPESMHLYLETRFEQLKVACDLELWQEAFRSVEDIQGLLTQSKKAPKPQMMATYYAKLTKIFTVSDSYLYNGYAW